jgi:SAM-dependent methyltransferase
MLCPEVTAFVLAALPRPPARVLEVGAGDGALAARLRELGYDVLAIDPAGEAPGVTPLALHQVNEPSGRFDAAVAVLSLHHVEPLTASCARLAELLPSGSPIIVDEFDVERFDERAAQWLIAQRAAAGADATASATALVGDLRDHLHPVSRLVSELAPRFHLGPPVRGAYLYRWDLPPGLRSAEEDLIARARLPATGARLVGIRR